MRHNTLSSHDKLKIVEEAKYNGVVNTCQKYGICQTNYYNWVRKITEGEKLALSPNKKKRYNDFFTLNKENETLKKLIEEKDKVILHLLSLNPNFALSHFNGLIH